MFSKIGIVALFTPAQTCTRQPSEVFAKDEGLGSGLTQTLEVCGCSPGPICSNSLQRNLRLEITLSTEKARSELIISPILVEVREALREQVSLFAGEEFNVDPAAGLNGVCDFIFNR
jgi:hypothetical protein